MSLQEKNRILEILYKRKVNRETIGRIVIDLERSGIFDDYFEEEEENGNWNFLEQRADIYFSDRSYKEKIRAIKILDKKEKEINLQEKSQYTIIQEKRVKAKRQEFIKRGIIKVIPHRHYRTTQLTTRYGRTPLHEAIAMRDIRLVEKYLKEDKYLLQTDNNGHTPMEMAYYENYKEALTLFRAYKKKKRKIRPYKRKKKK